MLAIDDNDKVITGEAMQGVTVLARFKKFEYFNGLKGGTINREDCKAIKLSASLTSAVLDGVVNYKTISAGGQVEMEPSPFGKLAKKLKLN